LLVKRADVNAQGGAYGNALQAAASGGHEAVVRLLIELGADANAQGGAYGSALQAAAFRGHEAVVKLLFNCGANVESRDRNGCTAALHVAAQNGRGYLCQPQVVRYLLYNGYRPNMHNGSGLTAIYLAAIRSHKDTVRLLLQANANI
ncbi:ankyrin, partial [Ascodesmis nigricans]